MRHVCYTLDTRQSKYDSNGGTTIAFDEVEEKGNRARKPRSVIGSPLTLIPVLYDVFGSRNAQVNALKAQLLDYEQRLKDYQRGVVSGRYNWKVSWHLLLKDMRDILDKAPVLHERSVRGQQIGISYTSRRHGVFAPISNVQIDAMRQHALAETDATNNSVTHKYFRMCKTGAHDHIFYRVYDSNFHTGLFGKRAIFPSGKGNRGTWDRAGSGGRATVMISGDWTATPTNAIITCIKRVDADGVILDSEQAFGVMVLQFDIQLDLQHGAQIQFM